MSTVHQPDLICNAVVFVYMLLSSFPCIGNEERATVQLLLEHIFTFNVELGRIVLTRDSYEHAQGLVPQLLVLASRRGLVYAAGRTPSFMNIATILQTIIEPLVMNLSTLAWMEVYATEDEARQLLKLSLPRLQAAIDTWVCEHSEITFPEPTPITSPQNDSTNSLTARKHWDAWWTSPFRAKPQLLLTSPEVVPKSTSTTDLPSRPAVPENVNVQQTPQLPDESPVLEHIEPVPPNPVSTPVSQKNPSHDLRAKKHKDVWWTPLRQMNASSPSAGSGTIHSKPAPIPSGSHSDNPTTCGYEGVWWKSYARGKSPGTKCFASTISKPGSIPTSFGDNRKGSLATHKHGDVWWNSLLLAKSQSPPVTSEFATYPNPTSTFPTGQLGHPTIRKQGDVWWMSPAENQPSTGESTLLKPIEAGVHNLHELHHPINLLEDRGAGIAPAATPRSAQHAHTTDFRIQPGSTRLEVPTSPRPSSARPPWDASSGAYSSSRDFSTSNPSSGPPTPMRSWGRQFSGSSPSFGLQTPADSVSARWDYDQYVASLEWAPRWDEESMSEDVHERPRSQVRKAKEATMGRKLVRKLKAVLASVRKST